MGLMSTIRKVSEEGMKKAGIKKSADNSGVFDGKKKDATLKTGQDFSKESYMMPSAPTEEEKNRNEWLKTLSDNDRKLLSGQPQGIFVTNREKNRLSELEQEYEYIKTLPQRRKVAEAFNADKEGVEFAVSVFESGKKYNQLTKEEQGKLEHGVGILEDVNKRMQKVDNDYAEIDKKSDDELNRLLAEKINETQTGSYSDRVVAGYVVQTIIEIQNRRYEVGKKDKLYEALGGDEAKAELDRYVMSQDNRTVPMTKEEFIDYRKMEYDLKWRDDPSMPEFGSYEYFVGMAKDKAPGIDLSNDEVNGVWWRDQQEGDPRVGRYRQKLEAFGKVLDAMAYTSRDGIHFNEDGSVNVTSGKKQAEDEDYLYGLYKSYKGDDVAPSVFADSGLLSGNDLDEFNRYAEYRGKHAVAEDVKKAYEYYEKYKDKTYDDNFGGWISGGWRLGVTDLNRGDAGLTLYNEESTDTEATDLYKMLSGEIVNNSGSTFDEGSFVKNSILQISQYAPQGLRQAGTYALGYAIGAAASWGNAKVGSVVGNLFSSADMYGQTAGQAYLVNLEAGLSAEDARIMATNEAALSAGLEFGVGLLFDKVGGKIANKIFKTTMNPAKPGKLAGFLMKKGMTHQGANRVVEAGYKVADFLIGNMGEGTEEFLQEAVSITAQRYAKEGKTVSALELLKESADFSKYSDEEFAQMGDSFKAGFVIGSFNTGFRMAGSKALGNSKIEAAQRALENTDAEYFGEAVLKMGNSSDVLSNAVTIGKESKKASTRKFANAVDSSVANGETVSAKDAGKLTKNLLLEGKNVFDSSASLTGNAEAMRDDGVYYLIEHDDNNVPFVIVENDVLDGLDTKQKEAKVREILSEKFSQGVKVGNELVRINKDTKREYTGSKYSRRIKSKKPTVYNDKLNALTEGDEVIKASRNYVGEGINHERKDDIKEFARGTVNLRIGGKDYSASVLIGTTSNDELLFYDLLNMTEITIPTKKQKASNVITFGDAKKSPQMSKGTPSNNSISQNSENSNKNVSDFDKLVAMGTNEYAESARAEIENDVSGGDTDVLTSIENNPKGKVSGVTVADIISGNIPEGLRVRLESFKKVIERMGFTVVYEAHRGTPKNTIGYVDFANREVYLSPAHIDEALLTHELTHIIDKGFSGKYVKSLVSFFKNNLSAEWDKKYSEVKTKYEVIAEKNKGFTYTDSTLEAETLAEMCTEFTTDEYIKKAANMEMGTIKQVIVMFNYVRAKLKSIFMDKSSDQKFKVASLKWQLALYKATKKGVNNSGSGVLFDNKSTAARFVSQLEKWDGKTTGFSFVLGMTSDKLRSADIPYRQIRWNATKIKTLLNKHDGMTIETIKRIPELLENPVVVIDSKKSDDSRIVMGDLYDENGKIVTVVLLLTPTSKKGNQLDVIKVSSAQGRSHIESLFKNDDGSSVKVRYVDKKRIQNWLNVNRLQLPLHSFNLDSNYSISQNVENDNKKISANDDVSFAVADDGSAGVDDDIEMIYDSLAEDSGAKEGASDEVKELEESVSLITEALNDEGLSRADRVALITERTKHRKRIAELKGDSDEGKVSRRKAMLDEYNETGDPAVLPGEDSIKASDRYDKKRIAEIRQEFAQIQEALRNDKEMTTHDREELISRKEALTAQLQQIAENNSVLSEIKDIVDGFGTGEHISHEWVNDVSADVSDPTVGGMIRQGVYNTNDVERNFKKFFGKHFGEAYDKVLKPFYESKKAYAEDVVKYAKLIRDEVVKKLGIKEGTRESAAVMWLGEGKRPLTQKELVADLGRVGAKRLRKQIKKGEVSDQLTEYTFEDCVNEFGRDNADKILEATKVFRKCYDELIAEINKVRAEIYPNNPDKLIKKRADYFRHFNEISSSIKGLRASVENNQGIDPMLVGLSEHTEPKSKWQSWEQKRTGNKTTYDAVGGFLDYLMSAEYAIHIDKNIVNFRSLARDLALAKSEEVGGAGNPDANGFIRYLQRFANHLAGKTVSTLDRAIADMPHGRQMIAVLSWVNNRAKANAVLGNMSSVVAQVSNIKNAVGKIDKTIYMWRGAAETFGGIFGKDNKIQRRYDESGFLKERFMGDELGGFETNWKKVWHAPKNFAAWILGFADEVGARITYNAAYNQAVARGVANPAEYADSFTRSCVAGRGIGDVPLVLQSQVAKLFLPFRVEVLNDMNVRADMLWGRDTEGNNIKLHKRIWRYTRFLVFCSVMNALLAAIKGDGFNPVDDMEEGFEEAEEKEGFDKVVSGIGYGLKNIGEDYLDGYGDGVAYDPLGDIAQGIYEGLQEGESVGGDIGYSVMRSFQNLFGDYMSNNPFASAVIAVTGADEDVLDELTNGKLYTPAGAGSPVFSTLWTTAKEIIDGDYATAGKEVITDFVMPWGGSQLDKSVRGMYEYNTGYSTTENAYERMAGKGGKLKYLIEPKYENFIKSLLFGTASFSEANDYYYTKDQYKLSEDDTKEVLKEKDYKGRKTKFDEIVSWKRYEDERKEALDKMEADYYGDNKDSALYDILYYTDDKGEKKRRDNVIPYGKFGKAIEITLDDRKIKGTITVEKAKEMNKLMGERLEYWYDMLDESEDFAKLSEDNKASIVSAVYNIEKEYMVAQELYRQGVITDYEYQNYGYDYVIKCAEKLTDIDASVMQQYAEDALEEWVNDRENPEKFAKYNAANTAKLFLDNAYFMDEETRSEVERYYETESSREPDEVDKELARLSYETRSKMYVYGDPYGILSYTKNGVKYALKVPAEDIYGIFETADEQVRKNLAALIKKKSYQNASDEAKKKMVEDVRSKVRSALKKKYKAKYPAVKVEDAYDRTSGDDVENEIERFYDSRSGDDIDVELDRVSGATGSRVDVSADRDDIFSYSDGGIDYSIQVDASSVYEIFSDYDTQVRNDLSSLFSESKYKNASDADKKKMIVSVRDKVRNRIRNSIKLKYPSIKMRTLFDRIVELKSE